MASTTLKTRLIINNKTASDFASDTSTVWLKGELLIENDTCKMKVGDGINIFGDLPYANVTPTEVASLIAAASHSHSNKAILDATTASFTSALLTKLNGIATGAEVNVQSDWNVTDTASDAYIKNKPTKLPASDVYSWAKAASKPTYTASEVGADPSGSANTALENAKTYTNTKISDLINGAPETLDTLKEIADAITENSDVIDTLNNAIGTKANTSDLSSHTGNGDIHVTAAKKTNWDSAYTHSTSAHAPSNAERNVVVGVQVNGSDLTPNSSTRKVNVSVPTKVSQLTNDSGYKTTDNNTTYSLGVAANSATNGNAKLRLTAGGSGSGTQDVSIKGSGATTVTTDSNGVLIVSSTNTVYTHPSHTAASAGLYKVTVDSLGHVTATAAVAKSDITALGIPGSDTKYSNMTGATSNTAGTAGLVPAPGAGASNRYLRSDGTWVVPPDTDTKYSVMGAATSSAAGSQGLVPAPGAGAQAKFLRGDGTWQTPTNTTYGAAGSSLGLVKTGGDVTITDGVITVSDDSHNHTIANVDGLQTALDGKAASSHGTHVSYSSAAPAANGTASAGSATTVSRSDHVHPLQTSVSGSSGSCTGNAGSATKLQTARNIGLTGYATATAASFNGSANVNINVTALNAMGLTVASGDTLILDGSI